MKTVLLKNLKIKMSVGSILKKRSASSKAAKAAIDDAESTVCSSGELSTDSLSSGSSSHQRRPVSLAVSFDESCNIVHAHPHASDFELNEETISELWFTKQEQDEQKEANTFSVKVARGSDTFTNAIATLYQSTASLQDEQRALSDLAQHISLQPAKLGLEGKMLKHAGKDRAERRGELTSLVYNLPHENTSSTTADQRALRLGVACRKISRPARVFAEQLGQAVAQSEQ